MLAELHPRLPTLVERAAIWIGRRRAASAAAAAVAVGAIVLSIAALRIDADVPLFDADLHQSQAAEVENALTLWGEPFRANPPGTQILVAAPRRRDILLRLTLAGLPRRYIPTSIDVLNDQSSALTPQSVIDDRRRSGIEGDLVAGLRRIAGVADATVVLPPASEDPLADAARESPPTAAVQLVMQPGEQLSAESAAGIRRFVASAYPGLTPERVTVVDGSGAVQGMTPAPDAAAGKERRVQNAVQSALDSVLGAGAAVVRVSVRTVGVERHMQSTRVIPRGALSADVAHERGSESGKSFDKEHTVRRFAYDTLSETRVMPADAQGRLSIAVFLNSRSVDSAAGGAIASLVRAAAGADLRSGDDVVVEAVPFAQASPVPNAQSSTPATFRALVPAAVVCAVALFGLASLPRVGGRDGLPLPHASSHAIIAAQPDPAALSKFEVLRDESPQTTAYVLASLSPSLRDDVLALYHGQHRTAIEAYLDRH